MGRTGHGHVLAATLSHIGGQMEGACLRSWHDPDRDRRLCIFRISPKRWINSSAYGFHEDIVSEILCMSSYPLGCEYQGGERGPGHSWGFCYFSGSSGMEPLALELHAPQESPGRLFRKQAPVPLPQRTV